MPEVRRDEEKMNSFVLFEADRLGDLSPFIRNRQCLVVVVLHQIDSATIGALQEELYDFIITDQK